MAEGYSWPTSSPCGSISDACIAAVCTKMEYALFKAEAPVGEEEVPVGEAEVSVGEAEYPVGEAGVPVGDVEFIFMGKE